MDNSESATMTDPTDVPETAATKTKFKVGKSSMVADVATLDIKSRLNLENLDEICDKPQTNGLHQVNGVCDLPQRNTEFNASEVQLQDMETSHVNLNQSGKILQLTFVITMSKISFGKFPM